MISQQPGFYEILQMELKTLQGNQVSIAPIVVNMAIDESIERDCMTGTALILDTSDLIYELPIRGEEELTITVKDALGQEQTMEMFVYRVSDIVPNKQTDGSMFKIHFMSKYRFLGNLKRVRRSFNDKISNIVVDIYNTYYANLTDKTFNIQETEGDLKCVIPNLRPFEAFKFLSERAYSIESPSSTYRHYESMNSMIFGTDEWLMDQQKNDPRLELTYNPHLQFSGTDAMDRMFSCKSVVVSDFNNTMRDLNTGALKHTVMNVDLENGIVEELVYDYSSNASTYKTPDTSSPAHSNEMIQLLQESDTLKSYINFKDYASEGEPPTNIRAYDFSPEILSSRIGYGARLNNTRLDVKTHGRLDLNAGRLVHLSIPILSATPSIGTNRFLTGMYQVVSVLHNFGNEVYECSAKLRRYDWGPGIVDV